LSELYSNKRVKLSYLKVGSSPVYYIGGQEAKLQNYTHVLKAPEKKAFEILKEKKLLKDRALDPVTRVALQNIKDFAKPIEITLNSIKDLYWKWYLLKNEEIKDVLSVPKPVERPVEQPKPEVKEEKPEVKTTPKVEVKETPKTEVKEPPKIEKTDDDFGKRVEEFFAKNKINIMNREIKRANSEIEYELLIPSAVGKIHYYAVAKSKKKLNDADLSQIFVNATVKKLPVLFIHAGDMTKKAKMRLRDEFKLITTYKI